MNPWTRWLSLIAGLAATFVAISSVVLAIRQGSWGPIISAGWIPAVVAAAWPERIAAVCPAATGRAG